MVLRQLRSTLQVVGNPGRWHTVHDGGTVGHRFIFGALGGGRLDRVSWAEGNKVIGRMAPFVLRRAFE
jgi:hypothetical protein